MNIKKEKTKRDCTGGAGGALFKQKLKQKTDRNTSKNAKIKQKQRRKILKKTQAKQIPIYSLSLRPARPPPQDSGQPPRLTDFAHETRKKIQKAKLTNLPHHSRPRQTPAASSFLLLLGRNFPISVARDRRPRASPNPGPESPPFAASLAWSRRSGALIRRGRGWRGECSTSSSRAART